MSVYSNSASPVRVAAVVLAAGASSRMGRPKMVLPWGQTTVIRQVVTVLEASGCLEIIVVTGGARLEVEPALDGSSARVIFNPFFAQAEMLSSLKVGLQTIGSTCEAVLVVLGDQPQIEVEVVRKVIAEYAMSKSNLIVPSYQMRRGHPWLAARCLWPAILDLSKGETLRSFMNAHADLIHYCVVDRPSILCDLDTPEDWERQHPQI